MWTTPTALGQRQVAPAGPGEPGCRLRLRVPAVQTPCTAWIPTSTPSQPGPTASRNAPTAVSHRLVDDRISTRAHPHGMPTTRAIATSGRICTSINTANTNANSIPTAVPTSSAPASSHARGRGITQPTLATQNGTSVLYLGYHHRPGGLGRATAAGVVGTAKRGLAFERFELCGGEGSPTRQEPHALGRLHGEAAAASGDRVDDELRVLPRIELRPGNPHRRAFDDAQQHVAVADDELAVGVTHRRRPVTAPAGLMKHQRAVAISQTIQQPGSRHRDEHPRRRLRFRCDNRR